MKAKCCFVHVPENAPMPRFPNCPFPPGRYTMYYYGPSQAQPGETIVESLKGVLTTVPKEWVRFI